MKLSDIALANLMVNFQREPLPFRGDVLAALEELRKTRAALDRLGGVTDASA